MVQAGPVTGSSRSWDAFADDRGVRAVHEGQPTRWFEEVWSAGARDEIDLPWDRRDPYPPLTAYLAAEDPVVGGRAVVVGAGLGADAELLARHGFRTTAFDIAPSAVALTRSRYPGSTVDHRVADLLDLPGDLVGAFDLVVEIFTVQALHPSLRSAAQQGIRRLLAPGGEALVVQFVRQDHESAAAGPPWLLNRAEMEAFGSDDVAWVTLDTRPHPTRPDGRPVWVGVLRRRAAETRPEPS
jgi:SAM-dependent methyltransferase